MAGSRYQERPVGGWLGRHLACRWTEDGPEVGRCVKRVVPDGCIDLMWRDGTLRIAGPDTGPVLAVLRPGAVAGVRFRPGQAPAALGLPAAELRDLRVDLADVWGEAEAARIAERLHAAPDAAAATLVLEQAVADRLLANGSLEPDPLVAGLVSELRTAEAPLRVSGFAEHAGVSERQLHRRCVEAVGYSAKTLDRVLRLQRFLAATRREPAPGAGRHRPLADLAAAAGYADQAHLTRECRRLTGVPPTALVTVAR